MRKLKLIVLICLLTWHVKAQDSSKVFTHEAGVSIFAMLGQVSLFVPAENQLPYDFFYNFYYKKVGARAGLGVNSNRTETEIEGQQLPRVTTIQDLNYRLGISI